MDSSSLHAALVQQTNDLASTDNSLGWKLLTESKKLWRITAPAIWGRISMYGVNVITQAFVGHIGDLELASLSLIITVIWALSFGLLSGLASALQTLCGQAFGAQQYSILGLYLQRSWIVLFSFAIVLLPLYVFATPILKLLGQQDDIADLTGKVAIWCIPMHFALVFRLSTLSFLQSQSKNMVTASITFGSLIVHVVLCWLFTVKLGLGFGGAVASMNIAWWIASFAQVLYVVCSGCPLTWTGFSKEAFCDIGSFFLLSIRSGIMICVEIWYYRVLVLLTGNLKDPEVQLDSLSICLSINGWEFMIPFGFMAGTSVRVANELGAGNGKAARFAVAVSSATSIAIGTVIMIFIVSFRDNFASIFTDSVKIQHAVSKLAFLLAFTILLNSLQPILSGAAIGSGKQGTVAYVNLISYYIFGVPLGAILGYLCHLEVTGIWIGMICGTAVQTIVLLFIICRNDWLLETTTAEHRLKTWSRFSKTDETLS